jgi:hypothetical protein
VTPLFPLLAGVALLVVAWLVLRSIGPGVRVGRLLATTPRVTVEEALRIAASGQARYVRVDGRIDAEEDFQDAAHRPLVLRRTRFQARRDGRWVTVDDAREAVPFTVREGLAEIAVDGAALDEGLVVVPRESIGIAADAADRVPPGLAPETPLRARIDQVSSVEHAIVLGVPATVEGVPTMTEGMGRPLVLTTLEPPEAMRILAGDTPRRPRLVAFLLLAGVVLLVLAIGWWLAQLVIPPPVAGASPTPGTGGDPRSSGEGPGLVGQPLLALGIVGAIAILSVLATLLYVRLSAGAAGQRRTDR